MPADRSDFLLPNATFVVMCALLQSCLLLKSYVNRFLCEFDSHVAGK